MNDTEEFELTDTAFDVLLFTPEEKLNCYKLMSALMHVIFYALLLKTI